MRRLLLAFLLVATGLPAAEPVEFPDRNFRIEIPAGWEKTEVPDPNILLSLQSGSGDQTLLVSAAKLSKRERLSGASAVRSGIKTSYEKNEFIIDAETSVTVKGIPYLVLSAHSNVPKYIHAYVTSADSTVYVFQLISDENEPKGSEAFQSVLESFRLIRPVEFTAEAKPAPSRAYEAGRLLGTLTVLIGIPLIVLAALIGGAFGIYRLVRKKR